MDDKDNKENYPKGIPTPERRVLPLDQEKRFDWDAKNIPEKKETSEPERYPDKIVSAELRREIETMKLDENTKAEAEKKAQKIEFLGEKEKIEHLLEIAREKGLVFAIQVARRTNDPYILDILHDILAQEGYYKDFLK